jgi:hypothetical protein
MNSQVILAELLIIGVGILALYLGYRSGKKELKKYNEVKVKNG